jgi:hypothetical protein
MTLGPSDPDPTPRAENAAADDIPLPPTGPVHPPKGHWPDEADFLEDDDERRWDANDPRRQKDCFAPPTEPCECYCITCGRTFNSEQIWFQRVINDPQGFEGFWMCPTPNCGGAGFTFEIFPTDPDHPANAGWHTFDDEEVPWDDDEEGEWSPESDAAAEGPPDAEYDPTESKYQALDELYEGEPDDDIEGEEWKYGLSPGDPPPPGAETDEDDRYSRLMEERERMYDQPDQRPRVVDWSDRPERKETTREPPEGPDLEDDIPF